MEGDVRSKLLMALLLVACSSPEGPSRLEDTGGPKDAGPLADAGVPDAQIRPPAQDAGLEGPRPGFGVISGSCGELDDELTSPAPAHFSNRIDFGTDPFDAADEALLTEGGREILRDGNAGGSSLFSELFAYEVLHRCEGAELLKTETEIDYVNPMGKLTDLLVSIDGLRIGVSVTRAVSFPRDAAYETAQAEALLQDKLQDVLESSANVAESDRWEKQILHVIAYGTSHGSALLDAYERLDASVRADTVLFVTISDGDDEFLY